ncbi:FAD:protein FMN transferase [Pontibacter sp. 172403-2]|uniref:FAD:protein FMN transferase n=1 Tax=Pontibacter rufus TaxID=2791028 RepID=UPI0018AFFE1E|nr:FAD:protein FMN transferase [Pontibacter sp. 172403-2]MBF9253698.1 FAD:protein FMN transferase [Pontibacter sp. 172403-2]
MARFFLLLLCFMLFSPVSWAQRLPDKEPHQYKKVLLLMGTRFEFAAVTKDEQKAWEAIETGIRETQRIEALISEWQPTSQTSEINRAAGIRPVVVDEELYDLISRCLRLSRLTNGAFDISFAAIDKVWHFDGTMQSLPDSQEVAASVSKIGYEKIILDLASHSVFLSEPGMKIGFGAIGKGYAANRARDLMRSMGIPGGVVNAAGDLTTWGKQANGESWYVGIADPAEKDEVFSWLTADEIAVVTSGNYEKYVEIGGKRYSHIIDPRTGYPVSGLKSVTIVCPNAELADALATAVSVMGAEEGLGLINQLKGVECLLITDKDELLTSDNLHLHYYKNQPLMRRTGKKEAKEKAQ